MSIPSWSDLNIQTKITFCSLVSLIPMLIIVYTAYSFSNHSSQNSSKIIQALLVQNFSERIDGFLHKQAVLFHEWTKEDIYGMAIDFQEIGEIKEEMDNQLAAAPGMDLLLVTGLDGKVLYASDPKRQKLAEQLTWAQPLLKKPAGYVSLLPKVPTSETESHPTFLFSFPTHDTNGELNGLFLAFIQWSAIQKEMQTMRNVLIDSGYPSTSAILLDVEKANVLDQAGHDIFAFGHREPPPELTQWFRGTNDIEVREIHDTFISFARLGRGEVFSIGSVSLESPAHLLLVSYIPHEDVHGKVREMLLRSIITAIIGFLLILMTALIISKTLTNPIVEILKVILGISKGDLSNFRCSSNPDGDEIARIGTGINQMADNLETSRRALEAINTAAQRFVPLEYLKLLQKESIVDVELGNHRLMNMSLLFSDIRSFTTISENMTPKENFLFINSYLKNMGPVIRQHNGFIDKYIGDAIMALFAGSADDAVMAGVGMLRHLEVYNHGRQRAGYDSLQIGIGLNTGNLMLGTIGEDFRMEGTVISDAVNLAARIEGMTKIYGTPLLISEQTFAGLSRPLHFPIRKLDRVKVAGKTETATIYEVLEGEPSSTILLKKLGTKDLFEDAVALYGQKQFQETLTIMEDVYQQCPEDKAAKIYIDRCTHFLGEGLHEEWDGITTMHTK